MLVGKLSGFESRSQSFTALGECGSGGRKAGIKQPQQRVRRKSNAFWMSQGDAVFEAIALMACSGDLVADVFDRKGVAELAES